MVGSRRVMRVGLVRQTVVGSVAADFGLEKDAVLYEALEEKTLQDHRTKGSPDASARCMRASADVDDRCSVQTACNRRARHGRGLYSRAVRP